MLGILCELVNVMSGYSIHVWGSSHSYGEALGVKAWPKVKASILRGVKGTHIHLEKSRVQGRLDPLEGVLLAVESAIPTTGPELQQVIRVDKARAVILRQEKQSLFLVFYAAY